MKLKDKQWKEFKIYKLFEHTRGKRQIKESRVKGNIPYYSASKENNGLTDFISNPIFIIETDAIIYSTFGDAYFVKKNFSASDEITILTNKILTKNIALFVVQALNQNKIKYSFGRKAFSNKITQDKIMLPINKQNEPDWQFMENYMENIIKKKKEKYIIYATKKLNKLNYKDIEPLNKMQWKDFFIDEIFENIQRGKRLIKLNQIKGKVPYISSTALNNGIDNFIENNTKVRIFENCLTIANSGSVGSSFYHNYKFIASDHVTHLKMYNTSEYIYLFISALTNRFKEKYNFNREINDKRVSREKILLPINNHGNPDYSYMEQYIKNLEYKKLTYYINM